MTRTLLATAALAIVLSGCKKDPPATTVVTPVTSTSLPVPKDTPAAVEALRKNFERVNFEYDSARLTDTAKSALKHNADILLAHPEIAVEVQGHCDERGTTEYNLALGDRRATAVREYLALQGVPKARMSTVSFGEERPLATGATESVWAQNRRAEFKIRSEKASL